MFSLRARHYLMATSVAFVTTFSLDPAFGGIIATYDFAGGDTAAPTAANATFSPFGRVNVGSVTPAGNFKSDSWNNASTINTGEYVTFTVAPAGGYQMDLTSLVFTAQRDNKGPTSEQVRNSVTNGSTFATAAGAFSYSLPNTNAAASTWTLSGVTGQTGPVSFRFYGWNANSSGQGTLSLDNVALNGAISAIANNNTVVTADGTANGGTTTLDMGRIMIGQTPSTSVAINKSGSHTTTYSATPGNSGLTAAAATGQFIANSSDTLTLQLANNANGTASTGAKTWNVTIANTAPTGTGTPGSGTGANDSADTVAVQARILANRTITAAAVNLGKFFRGENSAAQSTTLASLAGQDDDHFTRISLAAGVFSSGGITLNNGASARIFNSATGAVQSFTSGVSANFATSGDKNLTVDLLSLGAAAGEHLAGETPQPIQLSVQASVYERAALSSPTALQIANAPAADAGGRRAAARVKQVTLAGDAGFTLENLTAGAVIAGGSTLTVSASFASAGRLNGLYTAMATATMEHDDQTIIGAAGGDLGDFGIPLSYTVTGNIGSGQSEFAPGRPLAGFGLASDKRKGTIATFLGGLTSAKRTVGVTFNNANYDRPSDVVGITGTGSDNFVLQLSFDPGIIGKPVVPTFELLRLGYFDPGSARWVDAGHRNTGLRYADYLQQVETPVLGDYGVDPGTSTLWVVSNKSGLFTAMPEPGTLALVGLGAAALLRRRR